MWASTLCCPRNVSGPEISYKRLGQPAGLETWLALLVGGAAVCCNACSPPDVSTRPPKVPTHPSVCRCCLLLPWLLPAFLPACLPASCCSGPRSQGLQVWLWAERGRVKQLQRWQQQRLWRQQQLFSRATRPCHATVEPSPSATARWQASPG